MSQHPRQSHSPHAQSTPFASQFAEGLNGNGNFWIETCKNVLKRIYLAQPEVPEDSWPPVSQGTYINLALIKQSDLKDTNEYARYTIQGDMDDVLKDKDSIEYENVFLAISAVGHAF